MYDLRAREFAPEVGRFLQRDRTEVCGGFNAYEYAWDNPLRFVDPLGTEPREFISGTPLQSDATGVTAAMWAELEDEYFYRVRKSERPSDQERKPDQRSRSTASAFAWGVADTLTSTDFENLLLGAWKPVLEAAGILPGSVTEAVRIAAGMTGDVDIESGAYTAGGAVAGFALGGVGGARAALPSGVGLLGRSARATAAAARAEGLEFSHWIPKRSLPQWLKRVKSPFLGNWVTPMRHHLHDPQRFLKGMGAARKLPIVSSRSTEYLLCSGVLLAVDSLVEEFRTTNRHRRSKSAFHNWSSLPSRPSLRLCCRCASS